MFETLCEPLAPSRRFVVRLLRGLALGLVLIVVALLVGMLGYHYLEEMTWVDAFANAAMILSGMGPLTPLKYNSGKIFAGMYALFSGLIFVVVMGVVFAPIVHRFFHKMHVDDKR